MKIRDIEMYSYPFPVLVARVDMGDFEPKLLDLSSRLDYDAARLYETENTRKYEWKSFEDETQQLLDFMISQEVVTTCKDYFGLAELESDPSFDGGGLVVSEVGGYLRYHHDFPYSNETGKYRVVNALLYLSSRNLRGGNLHLLDPKSGTVEFEIVPSSGTFVAFPTSKFTPHGFSRILEGRRIGVNSYLYASSPLDGRWKPSATEWL